VLLRTHVFPDVVDSLIFYWFLFCVNLLIFAAVTSEQIYAIFSSCVSNSCSYQAVGVSTEVYHVVSLLVSQANSAFHPSWVGKWGQALAGKAKAGMVHSISGWMRGVQVKLWDPLRTCATIPECLRGVFMMTRYTNRPILVTLLTGHCSRRWHLVGDESG